MEDALSSSIAQMVTILLQIGALILFYWLALLRRKVERYLSSQLDARQMELVRLLGKQAYAYAETAYRELKGPDKLSHAMERFEQLLRAKGIPFDAEMAKEAIEQAWLEMEELPRRGLARPEEKKESAG